MRMKTKGRLSLLGMLIIAIGLGYIAYSGIGKSNALGVENINQGLDLKGGAYIIYEADKENPTQAEMNSAISIIWKRLENKGYMDSEVAQEGSRRIRVEIPGVDNADQAEADIGRTAQLMFVSPEEEIVITGAEVKDAYVQTQQGELGVTEYMVALELNDIGKQAFADATTKYVGQPIYIILDDEIISAPTVNQPLLDGKAVISSDRFTDIEAKKLADLIKGGSLPFNLTSVSRNNIGAKLGADALSKSIFAGMVGFSLVVLFMVFVYGISGLSACIALVFFVTMELIALSMFHVTLTLPGIAGIILSVGMAVDADVIIFERIKEELNNGKPLKAAIDSGFKRAFPAILDGNVTTLIAAIVLYIFGTGPIKGFAQTLTLGIIISMFTALVIARIIIKNLVAIGIKDPKLYGLKVR